MKNRSAIITLFAANLISGVAQGITMIAIPWYFAQINRLETFGAVFILTNAISLFWVPSAGILVDKYNRKRIFQILNVTIGSLLMIMALTGMHFEGMSWWSVSLCFMFSFFNYNIHYPTLYAFTQEVTEEKYYARITSALEIQGQVGTMTAGAFADLLLEGTLSGQWQIFGFHFSAPFVVAPWPIERIILLDAITYFAAFLIISLIRFVPLKKRVSEIGGVLTRLKIGWKFLKSHWDITVFGVASFSIFVTVMVTGFFLYPLYVKNHLHEGGDVYATIDMYYGAGAIFAGFMIHALFRNMRIPKAIAILSFLIGGVYLAMFATKLVPVFYLAGFLIGISNAGARILRVTYLFRYVPNQVFGRASSIFTMINILFRIFFLLIFAIPFFFIGNNVIWACFIMAVFVILSGLILLRSKVK